MTISKGTSWGELVPHDDRVPLVTSDAEAAAMLLDQLDHGMTPVVRLCGGELLASLGGPADVAEGAGSVWRFPVDLGLLESEGIRVAFLSSVVLRRRSWTHGVAYMNGPTVGRLRLGHRGHVNDGWLDRVEWALRPTELPGVARRAGLGAHTPHPAIVERRVRTDTATVSGGDACVVDSRRLRINSGTTVRISVRADAGWVERGFAEQRNPKARSST